MVINFNNKILNHNTIQKEIEQNLLFHNAKLAVLSTYTKATEKKVFDKYMDFYKDKNIDKDIQIQKTLSHNLLPYFLDRENEFVNVFDSDDVFKFFNFTENFCGKAEKEKMSKLFNKLSFYNNLVKDIEKFGYNEDNLRYLVIGKFTLPIIIEKLGMEKKICKMLLSKNTKFSYKTDLNYER